MSSTQSNVDENVVDEQQSQQEKKKRRRGGWDAPASTNIENPATSVNYNSVANLLHSTTIPSVADVLITQQLAIQRTQNIAAQLGMQKKQLPIPTSSIPTTHAPNQMILPIHNLTTPPNPDCKIYVGSIYFEVSENDIRSLFSPFGLINKIDMSLDSMTGKSKGYCFIEFSSHIFANAALAMDGFELAGRKLKVSRPTTSTPSTASAAAAASIPSNSAVATENVSAREQAQALLSQAMGRTEKLVETNKIIIRNVHIALTKEDLHDIFSPFGSITSAYFYGDSTIVSHAAVLVFSTVVSAQEAFLQMNLFPLAGLPLIVSLTETEPEHDVKKICKTVSLENFIGVEEMNDPELKDEVLGEASRYGTLVDVLLTLDSSQNVKVSLSYETEEMAQKCFKVMNGRFFGKRVISATLS